NLTSAGNGAIFLHDTRSTFLNTCTTNFSRVLDIKVDGATSVGFADGGDVKISVCGGDLVAANSPGTVNTVSTGLLRLSATGNIGSAATPYTIRTKFNGANGIVQVQTGGNVFLAQPFAFD